MRSHRNLHQLLGIENTEVSPHEQHFAFGMGLGYGLTAGGGGGEGGGGSGHGLYASQAPHGGKIKPINWKKVGNTLKSGLKTAGHYLVPAATSALAGAAGTFLGGPLGGVAGAAAGKYAGDQIDKAVGLGLSVGRGGIISRHKPKQVSPYIAKEPSAIHDLVERQINSGKFQHLEGRDIDSLSEYIIEFLHLKPLNEKNVVSILRKLNAEVARNRNTATIRPELLRAPEGTGIKGSRSKTRKGRLDYMTHKGDIDYHEGGHEMAGDPYGGTLKTSLNKLWKKVPKPLHKPLEDLGKGAIKVAGYGVGKKGRFVKGSQEAKDFMASIRKKKVTGKGIDNNEPHSGAIRMSPYQNF